MGIMSLWLPILVSAGAVWIASAIIWMVMPWHKTDFSPVNDESAARAALKGLAPGQYMLPFCIDPKQLEDADMQRKFVEGPLGYITIAQSGVPKMGGRMLQSMIYNIVVGIICAYILTRTASLAGDYLHVFRIAGTVAFISYGVAFIQDAIWFSRPWSSVAKTFLDALIYALLTGGVFGWLAV